MQEANSASVLRDVSRIDVAQEREVKYWMQELHASSKEIKRAVRLVGSRVDCVRAFLRLNRKTRRTT